MSRILICLSLALAVSALSGCEEMPAPDPLGAAGDGGLPVPVAPGDPIGRPPVSQGDDPSLQLRRLTRGELERRLSDLLGPITLVDAEPDLHQAGFARVGARQVATSTSGVERSSCGAARRTTRCSTPPPPVSWIRPTACGPTRRA